MIASGGSDREAATLGNSRRLPEFDPLETVSAIAASVCSSVRTRSLATASVSWRQSFSDITP